MKIVYTSDLHYGYNGHSTRKIMERFLDKVRVEEPDMFIIAGDIISDSQVQYEKFFKLATEKLDCRILIVCGNHDFWDIRGQKEYKYRPRTIFSIRDILDYHKEIHERYDIYYLEDDPVKDKDNHYIIYGFDGWYKTLMPPSNDALWIPNNCKSHLETHRELNMRAHRSLYDILDDIKKNLDYTYKICVTHFAPYLMYRGDIDTMCGNTRHLDFLAEDFDYLICGHNHREANFIHEYENHGIRVLNSGSDYNIPRYKVLEI